MSDPFSPIDRNVSTSAADLRAPDEAQAALFASRAEAQGTGDGGDGGAETETESSGGLWDRATAEYDDKKRKGEATLPLVTSETVGVTAVAEGELDPLSAEVGVDARLAIGSDLDAIAEGRVRVLGDGAPFSATAGLEYDDGNVTARAAVTQEFGGEGATTVNAKFSAGEVSGEAAFPLDGDASGRLTYASQNDRFRASVHSGPGGTNLEGQAAFLGGTLDDDHKLDGDGLYVAARAPLSGSGETSGTVAFRADDLSGSTTFAPGETTTAELNYQPNDLKLKLATGESTDFSARYSTEVFRSGDLTVDAGAEAAWSDIGRSGERVTVNPTVDATLSVFDDAADITLGINPFRQGIGFGDEHDNDTFATLGAEIRF